MTRRHRARITAGLGAAALAAGLLATGPASAAQAATSYAPTPADFKDCPALPAGAQPLLWNCLAIVITDGQMKLGGLTQDITKPITIPVAVGLHDWKIQLRTPEGGFRSDPIDVPKERLPLPIDGIKARVAQAGPVTPGKMIIPDALPLKIGLDHWLFADQCSIGSDKEPISIRPNLGNLGLGSQDGKVVIKTTITDDTFAVPAATGCGLLTGVLNPLVKLPSAAGKNSTDLNTVIRVKNYAFGDNTQSFAKEQGIR
ncbi:hypothetical protein [Actinomadura flavalba]|uniref:hypothetical protein n=1 Tax=Actinomadura flavalba TaxID=1120938 RepID=UPI000369D3D0|nr:hypothetical protein [Actinomadura flavalba]